MPSARFLLLFCASLPWLTACSAAPDGLESQNAITVDTSSAEARAQYDANVAFASAYSPQCTSSTSDRPRVLIAGFGRFLSTEDNATGHILASLVPAVTYPETKAPAMGKVDPPGPQLSVALTTLALPQSGEVDVCALILPVYWDLAAIVIAREIDAFSPSFVLLNGVAAERQPLWLELGSTNRARKLPDGSNQLRPVAEGAAGLAKIIEDAPESEDLLGNLLSWAAVRNATATAILSAAETMDGDARFGDIVPGVTLAGFPRAGETYLCNNISYAVGWLMGHSGQTARLLRADPPLRGKVNEVDIALAGDFSTVPRVFVHWPSELATKHHATAAGVMSAIVDAQLASLARGEQPTVGDNADADPSVRGGDTY